MKRKGRRFAASKGKPDANQKDIVDGLRVHGYSVLDLHAVGGGCPDILAGSRKTNVLLEIKTADGELNDAQSDFFKSWLGPKDVVRTLDEALASIARWSVKPWEATR